MKLSALPYAIGAFLLLPFAIWLVLVLSGFSGPAFAGEDPVANALIAVSLPLVLWFALSSLGSLANAMGGRSQFAAPAWAPVRWTLRLLPWLTLAIGVAAGGYLVAQEGARWTVALPLVVAVVIAFAIRTGEAERPRAAGLDVPARRLSRVAGPALGRTARTGRTLALRIPLLGWMLRDAASGRPSARWYLALNLFALWLVLLWFGGLVVIIWTAILATLLVFAAIILLAERG